VVIELKETGPAADARLVTSAHDHAPESWRTKQAGLKEEVAQPTEPERVDFQKPQRGTGQR